jgi:DNA-binding transcriptional MerR regulator
VSVLRVIKAAQRLAFTLDEVADLLQLSRHRPTRRPPAGLQSRAPLKLVEVQARIDDLQVIRDNLLAAADAGCDDLLICATTDSCPLPFAAVAVGRPA